METEQTQSRRALVTGVSGFIGSHLARRLLAAGWEVHVVVRAGSRVDAPPAVVRHVHDGSTRGMVDLVARAQPTVVFHLASCFLAQHRPEDIETLVASNLLFSTQLVEAMVANHVDYLINTGTSWQHYEDSEYRPVNLYAATKQAFEDILAYYIDAHGLRTVTLALFDTYGPGDPRQKLVSLLWKTALTQEPLSMSPGQQLIDIVHVDDVVEAFVLAAGELLKLEKGHVRYGVSSGSPRRLIDLVADFEKTTGLKLPITWGGRPYRPREVMVPWTQYASVPGWKPKVSFETALLQAKPS